MRRSTYSLKQSAEVEHDEEGAIVVGMRDVAKKAGVSLSTVSLVVNGN